jgi:hypothetical protein
LFSIVLHPIILQKIGPATIPITVLMGSSALT